jgi:ankyrin repeat protein
VDLAGLLIEHGADVTAQSKDGTTSLHWASFTGDVDLARFLIEHGADVEAESENGTPLYWAYKWGHVDLARLLISLRAAMQHQPLWHRFHG